MIVVIADDLTGAAEIGGIGLAHGLKAELQRRFCPESSAALLIIDTDSRSLPPEEAGVVMRGLVRRLKESGLPVGRMIYKKTDSVLRGPVAAELEALREVWGAARVLLVPANPSKGRTIHNGRYFIHGRPLSETDFANDPEYPAVTSDVLRLPAMAGSGQVHLLKCGQALPGEGLMIGEASTAEDLSRWAGSTDRRTIPAGAGEFFEAILRERGLSAQTAADEKEFRLEDMALLVCGSSSDASRRTLRNARRLGIRICRMPEELFRSDGFEEIFVRQWCDEITGCLEDSRRAIMAVDREAVPNAAFAGRLCGLTAKTVSAVFREIPLKELFVEGGATASRIAACLGWSRFEPCEQSGPGVVRMKVMESDRVCLTLKPGSYPWPENIRNLFLKGSCRAD